MFCVGFLLFVMLFLLFFMLYVCRGSFLFNPVFLSRQSDSPDRIPHAPRSLTSAYVLLSAEEFLPLNKGVQVLHIYPVPVCGREEDEFCLRPEGMPQIWRSLDLFHRIIECRNNRNTDHQSGFSVERNFPCIFQHQSVSPSCKLLMFFLVHMFDIHQIYIQVRKNLFDLFPGSTCHALYCGINTTFFCRTEKISGKSA